MTNPMKTTVIFHSADMDGIFCREIAKKFMPDAELIGWNFGEPLIHIPEGVVYILDLSPDCLYIPPLVQVKDAIKNVIWIDHHKTSIEKWPENIPGYRIDGVAACRLAWQWFSEQRIAEKTGEAPRLPEKQAYIDRSVCEPLAVRLAGEYDIWDKRDPDAETFQYGLRALKTNGEPVDLQPLLETQDTDKVNYLLMCMLGDGKAAQRYAQNVDASICRNRSFLMVWEGLKFLCINSARFNSLFFAAKDVPETGHDALMGFCWDGKCWTVSLYHARHNTGLDLSVIAKKYGGGGHRGACGMTLKELPFTLA